MASQIFDNNGKSIIHTSAKTSYVNVRSAEVNEQRYIVDHPFMQSQSVQTPLPNICIIKTDVHTTESKTVHFNLEDEPDFVEMHFTLNGKGCLESNLTGHKYLFAEGQHNMHYMPQFQGKGVYEKNMCYQFVEIRFSKTFFLSIAENSNAVLMDFADKVIAAAQPEIFKCNLPISITAQLCLQDLLENKFNHGLKQVYQQSKCIELLALLAAAYEEHGGRSYNFCKTQRDVDSIYFARQLLIQNIDAPPSLTDLAKMANINVFKLKKGFKEIFKNTVFGYLNDFRLAIARKELIEKRSSIKELSIKLGYSSVQHFSKAFKGKFGVSPGQI